MKGERTVNRQREKRWGGSRSVLAQSREKDPEKVFHLSAETLQIHLKEKKGGRKQVVGTLGVT